jgi:hypothetical protein
MRAVGFEGQQAGIRIGNSQSEQLAKNSAALFVNQSGEEQKALFRAV